MPREKKWGKEDDAKLQELFRKGPHKGGVSTTDLDIKAIKAINQKHFPSREYKNFAPLFRKKARAWNLAETLKGGKSLTPFASVSSFSNQCIL